LIDSLIDVSLLPVAQACAIVRCQSDDNAVSRTHASTIDAGDLNSLLEIKSLLSFATVETSVYQLLVVQELLPDSPSEI